MIALVILAWILAIVGMAIVAALVIAHRLDADDDFDP